MLAAEPFGLSVQVLQEFYVNARKGGVEPDALDAVLAQLRRVPMAESSLSLFDNAVTVHRRYGVSHWDAAIAAPRRNWGRRRCIRKTFRTGSATVRCG
ncbi:MAG: hypothetical protein QM661_01685 [Solimonas sp.]